MQTILTLFFWGLGIIIVIVLFIFNLIVWLGMMFIALALNGVSTLWGKLK